MASRIKYGIEFAENLTDLDIELYCFREAWPVERGGLGQAEHFWNVVKIIAPKFRRTPWNEDAVNAFCAYREVSLTGCASSGKTGIAAMWGLLNFLASPHNTLVAVTTTSVTKAKKLIWAELKEMFLNSPIKEAFKYVDTPVPMIRHWDPKFSEKASISLIPAEQKGDADSIEKLVGLKAAQDADNYGRLILLVDEGPEMPLGIVTALSNLSKNPYFQVIILGNACDVFDPHGILSTPKNGWKSITVDDYQWETERGGICLHFDGMRSPNLTNDDKWPFLYTSKMLQDDIRKLGENSPAFWRQVRGFWREGGNEDTLYTGVEISQCDGMKKGIVERDGAIVIGGGDPAFTKGGDRFILNFLLFGKTESGKIAVEYDEYVHLKVDLKKQVSVSWQYCDLLIEECTKRGVQPFHFGLDATGGGQVFYELLCERWSRMVRRVGFGEKASALKVAPNDKKPASELYKLRVDEMWAVGMRLLRDRRIYGIHPDMAREMCSRRYKQTDKIAIESKEDMKLRTGKSPDIADAGFVALDVARQCGLTGGLGFDPTEMGAWEALRSRSERAYSATLPFHHD